MAEDSSTTTPAGPAATPPTTISLRAPSKYVAASGASSSSSSSSSFAAPPLDWLRRTWTVTHSTLSMWRGAQNVRITYAPYYPSGATTSEEEKEEARRSGVNDNVVEYEKKNKKKSGVKRVDGVERPDPVVPAAWNWRGKGWLAIASSHWEVLGWGERPRPPPVGDDTGAGAGAGADADVERWAVTWFAPTLFTQEGVDIYSDRPEGLSRETVEGILGALGELGAAPKVVEMVRKDMQEVAISLPWQESGK
ncbi:hypothetical protein GGR56DRAFT_673283 [Xylariaceae sp. FL0804]|nr:hypothetical protein GGR56DRAFT_673283 [Xylariaceae sp. FL0804]